MARSAVLSAAQICAWWTPRD